ncbi:MAG: cytochrome P450 [Paracoccaceae bacterium]
MLGNLSTKVPHVPRWTAFIDAQDMVRNPVEVLEKYRQDLGPTFTFHFGGARRAIVSTDPEFIQHVLKGNRGNYKKSDIQTDRMVEFQGTGLVNIHGKPWLRRRKLMARGFNAQRLSEMLPVQQMVLDEQMRRFDVEAEHGLIDIHDQMVRIILTLVGTSIFGRSMCEENLQQIANTTSDIQGFVVRQIVRPYLIPWFRISGQSKKYQKLRCAADRLVLNHIAARRAAGTGELDLLHILLNEPYHDTGVPMSEAQALTEAVQMMVAGNETSSNALTWVFYLLAQHPEHIALIRTEIEKGIGDSPMNHDNLAALEHTIRVIQEALRLYPPFWMFDRMAIRADEIKNASITAGTMVIPYIYGLHRNPSIWDEPERFDPSRFERDQIKTRHPYSYIPFGGGPRICIGNNMAMLQILLIVTTFVRRYDFAPASGEPVCIKPMMLLRPDGPVHLRFVRR